MEQVNNGSFHATKGRNSISLSISSGFTTSWAHLFWNGTFRKLRSYLNKKCITRNNTSVYNSLQKTNNCCKVYHGNLKSLIRVKSRIYGRLWSASKESDKYDLEFQRLKNELEIDGRSKKDVDSERQRLFFAYSRAVPVFPVPCNFNMGLLILLPPILVARFLPM